MKLQDRVNHAAQILDVVQPGWDGLVDLDLLDSSGTTTDIAALLGVPSPMRYDDQSEMYEMALIVAASENYEELDDAWREAVETRRSVSV